MGSRQIQFQRNRRRSLDAMESVMISLGDDDWRCLPRMLVLSSKIAEWIRDCLKPCLVFVRLRYCLWVDNNECYCKDGGWSYNVLRVFIFSIAFSLMNDLNSSLLFHRYKSAGPRIAQQQSLCLNNACCKWNKMLLLNWNQVQCWGVWLVLNRW